MALSSMAAARRMESRRRLLPDEPLLDRGRGGLERRPAIGCRAKRIAEADPARLAQDSGGFPLDDGPAARPVDLDLEGMTRIEAGVGQKPAGGLLAGVDHERPLGAGEGHVGEPALGFDAFAGRALRLADLEAALGGGAVAPRSRTDARRTTGAPWRDGSSSTRCREYVELDQHAIPRGVPRTPELF